MRPQNVVSGQLVMCKQLTVLQSRNPDFCLQGPGYGNWVGCIAPSSYSCMRLADWIRDSGTPQSDSQGHLEGTDCPLICFTIMLSVTFLVAMAKIPKKTMKRKRVFLLAQVFRGVILSGRESVEDFSLWRTKSRMEENKRLKGKMQPPRPCPQLPTYSHQVLSPNDALRAWLHHGVSNLLL